MKNREWVSAKSYMESFTTIVLHFNRPISIIKRRQEERITYHLPPMLPAGIETAIIIIILSAQMVRDELIMIMVYRDTLVLSLDRKSVV